MMPRLLTMAALCLGLLTFSACHQDTDTTAQGDVGFHGNARPVPTPRPDPTPTTKIPLDPDAGMVNATPPTQSAPPASTPSAPVVRDVKYGIPVPGKPGYVISPYAPDSGQIDVRGFAPGQEALDPLTNKVFLVP